ncbi:MAG TPA: hypothetical protein VF079_04330 [Sphingomicrobium sp.]
MKRWFAIVLVLLSGCVSAPPEADLQYVKQARSLAAEWALINEQAAEGRLIPPYVATMREWLRDGLETASKSLTDPDSAYGGEIHALLNEPPNAAPGELRAHVERLKHIEDQLESA